MKEIKVHCAYDQMVDITDLKPNPHNPNTHSDRQIEMLSRIIEEQGWRMPIKVSNRSGLIVSGHGRYETALLLGVDKVPVDFQDYETEEQEHADLLADNKIAELAEIDNTLLKEIFQGMDLEKIDIELTGYTMDEYNQITNAIVESLDSEGIDDAGEPQKEPKAKRGDIYQLGRHRLMCGDSTSITDMGKLIGEADIDMVFTDPPYGISVVGNDNKIGADRLVKNHTYMAIKGDDTTETAEEFYNTCISLSIENFIIWGGNYFTKFLPFSDSWLIWDKRGDMNSNNFADGEMAWCSFHTPVRIYKQIWNGMIREGEREKRVHPTQKPVKMLTNILDDFTDDGDRILDGFGGSGSTLLACEKTDRICYIMEYEPNYIDVIIDRWEKLTGEKAVLVNE